MTIRKSDGGGLMGNGYRRDPMLVIARRLANKDWENPKDIRDARRMAHAGMTTGQIGMALGWDIHLQNVRRRLKKYNIVAFDVMDRAHDGLITGLSNNGNAVSMLAYRPKQIGAAP